MLGPARAGRTASGCSELQKWGGCWAVGSASGTWRDGSSVCSYTRLDWVRLTLRVQDLDHSLAAVLIIVSRPLKVINQVPLAFWEGEVRAALQMLRHGHRRRLLQELGQTCQPTDADHTAWHRDFADFALDEHSWRAEMAFLKLDIGSLALRVSAIE